MSGNGGAVIVLVLIWGFVAYYLYHYGERILAFFSPNNFLGSIIKFLW